MGDKLSFVDFMLWEQLETLNRIAQDDRVFTKYENFKNFSDRVKALPKFAEYLASDKFISAPSKPPSMGKIDF